MKKYLFLCFMALSCQKETVEPHVQVASKSETTNIRTVIPLDVVSPSPCTGQSIHWIGSYKGDVNITISGSEVRVVAHDLTQLKGTDSLGNSYMADGSYEENYTFNFALGEYTHLHTVSRQIILGKQLFHFEAIHVISSKGEVKTQLGNLLFECIK